MGSLLDGIETGTSANAKGNGGGSSRAGAPSESAKTIKLAIIFVGLLVGGGLIAWNLGVFTGPPTPPLTPESTQFSPDGNAPPAVRKVEPSRTIDGPRTPLPQNEMIGIGAR